MAGNLDEQGYLDPEAEEALAQGWCSADTWERCLNLLHQLEPHGVGARNVVECLLIQLRHSSYADDEICQQLIKHHLNEIALRRYDHLAKQFQVTVEEILERIRLIQSFHPKPGSLFMTQQPKYIVPDLFVERRNDGTFVLEANDGVLPRIRFNREYALVLKDHGPAKPFLKQKMREYVWLVRGIRKRRETLLKVAEVIIRRQYAFFENSDQALVPLTLKNVAEELGLHESTVSRAVNHKYMQTPRGLYELKFFFQQGLLTSDGEKVSESKIKSMIQQLIKQENQAKPLSDQAIAHQLAGRGIPIARRTVAKYRDEMGIPPSHVRKRT
jgi:RNA polymerase sigma-54 factor